MHNGIAVLPYRGEVIGRRIPFVSIETVTRVLRV